MLKKILQITKPIRYLIDKITFNKSKYPHNLSKLKGSLKNKPLLIVGNGPSLNKTPLDKFMNINSIGMNKIDLIFKKTSWRPSFILATNSLVIKQHVVNLTKLNIPCYLSWKSRYFVPKPLRKYFTFFSESGSSKFSHDITVDVGLSATVTYTALQFAYFMEADPIILVGVDHNFSFDGNPNEYKKRKGEDINHFDPNYFAEGSYWGLPNMEASEFAYLQVKNEFHNSKRKVYDATVNGKLNIFTKISIDEALSLISKE